MTNIQKNVMTVIDAMLFLTWPPRTSAFTWTRLIKAVSQGQKMVLKSQEAFYVVMKVEPSCVREALAISGDHGTARRRPL